MNPATTDQTVKVVKAATRDAYGKTLIELAKAGADIVVLDADLSGSTRTAWFGKEFPDRFINMGVSEADMIGTAVGLSLVGKIPFASTFSMFASGRAWEQIRNMVCLNKANVKIVVTHGGITVGEDGASHQALEDIAITRAIPNLNVVVPADAFETASAIKLAAATEGPFYIRLTRNDIPNLYASAEDANYQLGKGRVMREGKDVTLIGCGQMVYFCLQAADILAKQNISARVINMVSIKPIDSELIIKAAKETKGFVTVEEHSIYGGLGSAVAEVLVQNHPAKVEMIGMKGFGTSGVAEQLMEHFGLTANEIALAAQKLLK